MNFGLNGKVAIVTGGSKGIGLGIVRQLLAEGALVVNVGRSPADPADIPETAAANYRYFPGDLVDLTVCERAVEHTLQSFGALDILVNNAGVNDGAGLDAGPAAFLQSLQRNLLHYYAMAHHAAPHLKRSRGCIINIGSKVCETGQGGTSGYAASKGAINGLTREWAVELAPAGVRVNAVLPAETWTPLYERCLAAMPDPTAARASIENLIPLGRRFTTIDELAAMVVFLASELSSHTTGQIIFVDGGYTHLDRKCTATGPIHEFGAAATT
ncbi:MAG: ral stress protein 39 [Planctomycetota bacterium]|jgi:NAD(P)-dependent dehydrogenase (short-subunit alcohol dehydrogenase family)